MFIHYTTVKIEKDKNYIQYIKIIRNYDNSLSMSQLKKSIDNGEVVFSFDPKDNHIIANGKDNTDYFLETGVRTFSWTGYATNPRLCLYSIGLKYPNDFFILFSLYQRR